MSKIDLLIFDCDGVLIDSEPIAARTLAHAITHAGIAMTPRDVLVEFTGKSEPELRSILRERGLSGVDAVFAKWHVEIFAEFRRDLRTMDGIGDVLQGLDIAKCVASNSSVERLKMSLGLLDIWAHFAPNVFSAEMVAAPKPAPDLIELCLARMGASTETSIVIDDSPAGIQAARAAGVKALGFVAPDDPRAGRREVLHAAGAQEVAIGAEHLGRILRRLGVGHHPARQPAEVEP
ncbi:HAD-IA family hydrolase [Rhizobium sp. S96]|uniref:HAD-IA family hydrolase n=1 Tax=Rhizobium sp. S96 TaxID=3055140 RepID=UPI0025AA96D2|nr:HAD-IA family hydrolase [Rhizobium sp. S96]MDM9623992.1 HAD-IA family hydrolase [Rhizobium sp. S96]